jgi:hypothetical protein
MPSPAAIPPFDANMSKVLVDTPIAQQAHAASVFPHEHSNKPTNQAKKPSSSGPAVHGLQMSVHLLSNYEQQFRPTDTANIDAAPLTCITFTAGRWVFPLLMWDK